jgi:hypothetical protein
MILYKFNLQQTEFKPKNRFKLGTILNLFITLLFCLSMTGQNAEFLATINPTSGAVTQIQSIPGVIWIRGYPPLVTIDPVNERYYFCGMTSASVEVIYSSNINTGQLRSIGSYTQYMSVGPGLNMNLIGNFEFNESNGYIYGVGRHTSSASEGIVFFRMDTSNAQITAIGNYTLETGLINITRNSSTFDQAGQRYFIMATNTIYGFNATTGATISICSLGTSAALLRYNNVTGKAYVISNSQAAARLLEINITTCQILDTVATFPTYIPSPGWSPNGPLSSRASIDEQRNVYTFGDYGLNMLYSANLTTGSVVTLPNFMFINNVTNENVIEFIYSRFNGKLYGLNWGVPKMATSQTDLPPVRDRKAQIFPNPSSAKITLLLQDTESCMGIVVTNIAGGKVRELREREIQKITEIKGLEAGVYTVEVIYTTRTEKLRAAVVE